VGSINAPGLFENKEGKEPRELPGSKQSRGEGKKGYETPRGLTKGVVKHPSGTGEIEINDVFGGNWGSTRIFPGRNQ